MAALPITETVEEPPEHTARPRERLGRFGWGGTSTRNGLVVVGTCDGVDDLVLVEGLGRVDYRHEAHQHAVAHHLGLEPGGAISIPDRLTAVRQRNAYPELVHPCPRQVRVDTAVAEPVHHLSSPVLVHHPKVTWRAVPARLGVMVQSDHVRGLSSMIAANAVEEDLGT